ncbi:TRAFAC clade GTPase domain-containing protein [Kitasatospora sp. NBC_01266]|uniref:TRAFAC clade GTPase domain-containing protein n=1 Tax=Kitasatospora sp. NBC_01266 TaxID=2903572 RepID=UPI002E3609C2|nr:hypothetical protein [Kitasatospora sp. NBC_01266]
MNLAVWLVVRDVALALLAVVAVVGSLTALVSAPEFYGIFAQTAGRRLGPWRPGRPDHRIVLPGSGSEPAYASYWWRQVWVDAGTAARYGARAWWRRLVDDWLNERGWRRMQGLNRAGRAFDHWVGRKLARLAGLGIAVGAVVGAALSAAVVVVLLLLLAVQLGIFVGSLAATAFVARALERLWLKVRGIRMRCPYPGCWEAIDLPVYQCEGCSRRHTALRPGRYGVFRRVCQCGQILPTSSPGRRGRLVSLCPHCSRALPDGLGSARLVHLPLIGADSSGKTMLLMAAVTGLLAGTWRSGLTVDFGTAADQDRYERAEQLLRSGDWVRATTETLPQAFMVRVSKGRRRRLLYLYDPMGEALRKTDSLRDQRYLAHADGVLLVCDVLADREFRSRLSAGEEDETVLARPAREQPTVTFDRLAGEFQAMSGRRARTPVAVAVTKRDVLDGLESCGPVAAGAGVGEWLCEVGLESLVRGLSRSFGEARYWAVSSRTATGPQALDAEAATAAAPVLWLLSRTGLPVGALVPDGRRVSGAGIGGRRRVPTGVSRHE